MHEIAIDGLERHLAGNASQAFYAHLAICEECRAEVAEMEQLSALFRDFQSGPETDLPPEPRLGFLNRVEMQIIDHQRKEAWGLFAPDMAFFRNVAFASLMLLAGLGGYLFTHEIQFADNGGADAAAIMAQHDPSADHSESADRDRLMVTLATYHE